MWRDPGQVRIRVKPRTARMQMDWMGFEHRFRCGEHNPGRRTFIANGDCAGTEIDMTRLRSGLPTKSPIGLAENKGRLV